ncbi:MAG: conjugal transfer protein TraF [Nitrospirae bacterium]|nr:conjugal transfer protein TraF [Nitrospirota bacterium]
MFGQDIEKYKQQAKQALHEWAIQHKQQAPLKQQLCLLVKQMIIMFLAVLIFVIIMFIISQKKASAEAVHGDKPVRGWLWYEDPEQQQTIKPQPAPPKEEPKQSEPEKAAKKTEPKKDFEFPVKEDAPLVMKKWLKEPTEENAKEFLAWQYKYMEHLKKIGYSLRNAYIRYGDEIYPIAGYPESPLASVYYNNIKDDIYKSLMNKASGKLGLIYFYSKSCPNCRHQKDIVYHLMSKYNLSIRGVAVDGDIDTELPFPSSWFSNKEVSPCLKP